MTPFPEFPGYQVLRLLGKGTYGVVYEAQDVGLGRRVAIKVLLRANEPEHFARFRREREAMAQVDHPHLIRVHASGSVAGRPYVVLELLSGMNLADRLQQPYAREEGVEWVAQAAEGVGALHAAGLVHRDLKPENLLLDGEGRVKVADLGLVGGTEFTSLTSEGTLMGSPAYFAPEVCAGERTRSATSDVYSLGATLFEVLTGRLPHPAESLVALLEARQKDPNPSPRQLDPSVSPALAALCQRAMAGAPEQRYSDGAAFAAALRSAATGRGGGGQARALLVGTAALLALTLAGLGVAFDSSRAKPSPTQASPGLTPGPSAAPSPEASSSASPERPSPSGPEPSPASGPRLVSSYLQPTGQLASPGLEVAVVGSRVLTLERRTAIPSLLDVPRSKAMTYALSCLREWSPEGELLRTHPLPGALALRVESRSQQVAIVDHGEVRILEGASWAKTASLPLEGDSLNPRLRFSPSGARLAILRPPTLTIWEPESGAVVAELRAEGTSVTFRGEGQVVLERHKQKGGERLEVWDLEPPKLVATLAVGGVSDVAADERGWLYAAQWKPRGLKVWDAANQPRQTIPLAAPPTRIEVSQAAIVVGAQRFLCRLERPSMTARQLRTAERYLFGVAQGHGQVYATGYGQRLLILDEDLRAKRLDSGVSAVRGLASFGSNEWFLASGSGLWHVIPGASPSLVVRPPMQGRLDVWALSETGRFANAGGGRSLGRVDLVQSESRQLPTAPTSLWVVAVDAAGARVLAGTRVKSTWGPLILLDDGAWVPLGGAEEPKVGALTLSSAGDRAWVGRVNGRLEEWALGSRQRIHKWPDADRSSPLRILRGEQGQVWVACADGRIRRISSEGEELPAVEAHEGPVLDLCLLGDRLLSVGEDGVLRAWSQSECAPLGIEWRAPLGDAPARIAAVPGTRHLAVVTLRGNIYELAWD